MHLNTKLTLAASLAVSLLGPFSATQAADTSNFYLHDGDRVVMYGDSITDQRLYTVITEAFVTTRFPKLKIDWTDSGWGGDKVTGGGGGPIDLRLNRDVLPYRPTVVTIMLAMNDGGYSAFDQPRYETYTKGYDHIIDAIQAGAPGVRFTLILPSPYDDVTRAPNFDGGYNAVLIKYGDYVKSLAVKNNQTVADFNTPVNAMLQNAKTADSVLSQKILPDRVHPSIAGHLIMAEALLKSWNAPSTVSSVSIDAAKKRVLQSDNTSLGKFAFGKVISWDETDNSLPMPVNLQDPLVALSIKSSDFIAALDQETLQVTGLKAAKYDLKIDDVAVGSLTREALASGVNLATMDTPMARQAQKVYDLTKAHDDLHAQRWRTIQVPLATSTDPAVQKPALDLMAALDAQEVKIVAQQRETAQPIMHHFTLTPSL